MLLRRPPQRTRTAKESGQNETKKQSTATTTTTEMITFQFEAKLYPLGVLTEMPMLRLRPQPKPKRRPMLLPLLLLMMLRRTLEQSVRAKNRTQKAKKPNRQRSIQFFSFFLFCFVGRRVLGIAIKKSENSNNAKSLTHTHKHTQRVSGTVGLTALTERIQGRQKTGDWRIDSQPGSIPKSQLHFHCIFSCSYSCPDPTRPDPIRGRFICLGCLAASFAQHGNKLDGKILKIMPAGLSLK